ncbi:DUF7289 family protein [Halorarius halobius]|uniref:DUF7289 family protein n=1 Tax=Halorarius halobius TaxID=2962671 RepID=UPI0020CC0095|nr:hypothetical protein [Halorarius halobius]
MTDRGQAETLGYVLVFSIVVLTVALVTVSGQAGLAELRTDQRTANVERGFAVLADNVDDVVHDGVPSRATELDLSGERVGLGDPVTVSVTARYADGSVAFDRATTLRPVVYRADDGTELVYANGAVVTRGPSGGVAMLRGPRLLLSAERSVVPVVNTSFDRDQLRGAAPSVARESRVLVRTERLNATVLGHAEGSLTLTLTVDSPRAAAWARHLDARIDPGSDDCTLDRAAGTVTCEATTDAVTVVRTDVAVSFE